MTQRMAIEGLVAMEEEMRYRLFQPSLNFQIAAQEHLRRSREAVYRAVFGPSRQCETILAMELREAQLSHESNLAQREQEITAGRTSFTASA